MSEHRATGCAAWLLLALYTWFFLAVGFLLGMWLG
jgi:hypothetical protein